LLNDEEFLPAYKIDDFRKAKIMKLAQLRKYERASGTSGKSLFDAEDTLMNMTACPGVKFFPYLKQREA
jgi:hypothetical protein